MAPLRESLRNDTRQLLKIKMKMGAAIHLTPYHASWRPKERDSENRDVVIKT
jgi:hypothetical protein